MARKSDKDKKPRVQKEKRFGLNLSAETKQTISTVTGLIVLVFGIFTLFALVSYLFTWQKDQSLLDNSAMMSLASGVSNWAGKFGFLWSDFLIARCFGLASFALVIPFTVLGAKMLCKRKINRFWRNTLIVFTGICLLSVILSFIGQTIGNDIVFGGGLGGRCGAYLALCLANLVGTPIGFLILLILSILWLIFLSSSFAGWFRAIGTHHKEEENHHQEENYLQAETMYEENDELSNEAAETSEASEKSETIETSETTETDEVSESSTSTEPVSDPSGLNEEQLAKAREVFGQLEVDEFSGFDTEVVEELPVMNIRDELSKYEFPSLSLLDDYKEYQYNITPEEQEANKQSVLKALEIYHIDVTDIKVIQGPTITLYKIYIAPGVRISLIKNLEGELAIALKAEKGIRVVLLPDSVGIEVPNEKASTVPLKAMLNDDAFRNSDAELPIAIGYTISRKVRVFDLTNAPHLLVAGATQQGKSVGLNVIISSLLYSKHPSELKFVFIDPKMVEFSSYKNLYKHYLAVLPTAGSDEEEKENSIITDQKSANDILKSLCLEMDERYELLNKAGVNKVKMYNEKYRNHRLLPTEGHRYLPYIVTVIDEFADLTMAQGMGGDSRKSAIMLKESIIRLAQKGRAAGIHVILATQRPEANVVGGLIKSNCPLKIAFKVANGIDSKVIIGGPGAEKLIGRGDMLLCTGVEKERVQCAMVSMDEIDRITNFIGNQTGYKQCYTQPYYLPMPPSEEGGAAADVDMSRIDSLFYDAANLVVTSQHGSTSDLQRRLGVGYARAGKIMDQLETAGIVGPQDGSKPREIYVSSIEELEPILEAYR